MAIRFSDVLEHMGPSDLGPLLALTAQPDIISFAGGLPAPKTFPLKELTEVAVKVREEDGAGAMQYGPSLGFLGLREAIADRMNKMYMPMGMEKVEAKNIMVVTGSQQGLDIVGRVFLNKDDVVLCESPTYLGAIGAFNFEQPRYIEVPTDDDGIIPEELEKYLESTPNVKFIYVIPNYQNPTGRCMSLERRKKMMEIVTKYEIPVFEDNPYGDLRFEGEEIAPLITMDPKHLVMYSGTFSKTLAPGMRLAWMVCNDEILAKMDLVKGSTDLATPSVTQREVAMYMKNYDFEVTFRITASCMDIAVTSCAMPSKNTSRRMSNAPIRMAASSCGSNCRKAATPATSSSMHWKEKSLTYRAMLSSRNPARRTSSA